MAEKRLNIPAQMIQAGSRYRRSLLCLRQNEGALGNCLHECGEALGAPLTIAAVGVQRFSDVRFEHGNVFAEAALAGCADCRMRPVSFLHHGAEQTRKFWQRTLQERLAKLHIG
jgi:hypothetical protein